MIIPSLARGSPSLTGRVRLSRHSQLAVSPASLSKCSTPAEMEADEMVSQLSDQVQNDYFKSAIRESIFDGTGTHISLMSGKRLINFIVSLFN